jgi:hypothetical protein
MDTVALGPGNGKRITSITRAERVATVKLNG